LTADVGEVNVVRSQSGCGWERWWRVRAWEPARSIEVGENVGEAPGGVHRHPTDERGLRSVHFGDDERADPRGAGGERHRKRPRDRPQPTVQRQLAEEHGLGKHV
jgi:hypothetical protein